MVRVLNVAEKPRVAKAIAQALNRDARSRPSHSQYNPIWECQYHIDGQSCDMKITSVTGHLKATDFEEQWKSWYSCDPVQLFSLPVKYYVPQENQGICRTLVELARQCDWIILWLDCDREGEAIAYEVLEEVTRAKRGIRVRRAIFSELTPRAIHRALRTLGNPKHNDALAVQARQEIDLIIGAAFTRFLTMRLQKKFKDMPRVVSYGPCQFPTLGFVVDSYLKREMFVAEDLYTLSLTYSDETGSTSLFSWERGNLLDRMACVLYYELCLESPLATIQAVEEKPKVKLRPLPLTTVQLQILASRKLNMSAINAMKHAETLYQQGYISYPRTETDKFTGDTNLPQLIETQVNDPRWGPYATALINDGKFVQPREGTHNDNSHPPIHPTKPGHDINDENLKKLYELVARHFLACCSRDATGSQTIVRATLADEEFTAFGLMIKDRGYLEIYKYESWAGNTIPVFKRGDAFTPKSLDFKVSKTQPPPRLKEADLVKRMDQEGIGTDATIATHISTIQEREYARKDPATSEIQPTPLGIALVSGYNSIGYHMCSPNLRAQMERDMNSISLGTRTKEEVVKECLDVMKEVFTQSASQAQKIDAAVAQHFGKITSEGAQLVTPALSVCGNCEAGPTLGLYDLAQEGNGRHSGKNSHFLRCSQCDTELALPQGTSFVAKDHICPLCQFQVLTWTTKNKKLISLCPQCYNNPPPDLVGTTSNMLCFKCPKSDCALSTATKPVKPCSQCGKPMRLRTTKEGNKWYLGCSGYPSCQESHWACPGIIKAATPTSEPCPTCAAQGTFLVDLKLTPSNLPFEVRDLFEPGRFDPNAYRGCFGGCDRIIQAIMQPPRTSTSHQNNRAPQPRQGQAPFNAYQRPAQGGGRGQAPYAGRGGGNPGGGSTRGGFACFECGQEGHFAAKCPSKGRGGRGRGSYSYRANAPR